MRTLIIATIMIMMACSPVPHRDTTPRSESVKVMRQIPIECFDDNGKFDADIGTDTLDCGNLPR